MQKQVTTGVTAALIETKQFKTTKINVSFTTILEDKSELAMRTLIANLLEVSSQKYPNQKLISDKLAEMYGASFGTTVNRRGRMHTIGFSFTCVNDKYLQGNQNLLTQAAEFLQEVIFNPLVTSPQAKFDLQTFARQKENLINYIQTIKENKQTYASLQLQAGYFLDTIQYTPVYGDVTDLENINAKMAYEYYQKMLQEDTINIVISGDLITSDLSELLTHLPFEARKKQLGDIYYTQNITNTVYQKEEKQSLNQSKLDVAYHLPISYRTENYYAALVFNALFGGSVLSKLFTNVREKESMAYYASSNFDSFRQFLYVQTGIEAQNKEHVLRLIERQLNSLISGDVSVETFENVKKELLTDYESRYDSQGTAMLQQVMDTITQVSIQATEWEEKIAAVTLEEVCNVAKMVNLQAVYFLNGEESS